MTALGLASTWRDGVGALSNFLILASQGGDTIFVSGRNLSFVTIGLTAMI